MPTTIDINCDAGEGFGNWRMGDDQAIFERVSSANIASGFHAGDPVTLMRTVRLAKDAGIVIGAHPGLPDLLGFGRRAMAVDAEDVYGYLVYQIGAVKAAAEVVGGQLHHVKLHGAFPQALQVEERADAAAQAIRDLMPESPMVYYPSSGETDLWPVALKRHGIRYVGEIYPDLSYAPDGSLIIERVKHRIDPSVAAESVTHFLRTGTIEAHDGTVVPVEAESICLHSDGPDALEVLDAVNRAVEAEGLSVAAPAGDAPELAAHR